MPRPNCPYGWSKNSSTRLLRSSVSDWSGPILHGSTTFRRVSRTSTSSSQLGRPRDMLWTTAPKAQRGLGTNEREARFEGHHLNSYTERCRHEHRHAGLECSSASGFHLGPGTRGGGGLTGM